MKVLFRFLFLSIAAALTFSSCLKNVKQSDCIATLEVPILNVIGSNATTINTTIDLAVNFEAANGCGNFNSFIESTIGDTTYVRTIATYDGCVCTQDMPVRTGIYKFKKSVPGQYFLRFNKVSSSLMHTVTVQ